MSNKITKRSEETKKDLITRLNKSAGQVNGIIKMINEDRYCADVLIQISAAISSLKSTYGVILENHINNCVKNSDENFEEKIAELIKIIKRS